MTKLNGEDSRRVLYEFLKAGFRTGLNQSVGPAILKHQGKQKEILKIVDRAMMDALGEFHDDLENGTVPRPDALPPLEKIHERLGVRAGNAVKNSMVKTTVELIGKTERQLLKVPNFGKVSLAELKGVLKEFGLSLREDPKKSK